MQHQFYARAHMFLHNTDREDANCSFSSEKELPKTAEDLILNDLKYVFYSWLRVESSLIPKISSSLS